MKRGDIEWIANRAATMNTRLVDLEEIVDAPTEKERHAAHMMSRRAALSAIREALRMVANEAKSRAAEYGETAVLHEMERSCAYERGCQDSLNLLDIDLTRLIDPPAPSHPIPLAVGQRRRWKDGRRPDAFTVTLLSNEMVTLWHETEVCPVTIVRSFVESNSEPVEGGDR